MKLEGQMTISEQKKAVSQPTATKSDVNILAKGAGISLFGMFGGRALQLGGQILLARLLGPAGFGLFALGQTIFQLGGRLGTLGLNAGVIRFGITARQEGENRLSDVFRDTFFATFVSGLFFGGAVILFAPWLSQDVFKQPDLTHVLYGFGIAIMFNTWLNVTAAATRITYRMQYSALSLELLPFLVNLILIVALVYFLDLSIMGAVIALAGGYAAGLILSLIFVRNLFPKAKIIDTPSLPTIKELLSFSVPNSLAVVFNQWLQNVTVLFLGLFMLPAEIGAFQAAEQISMLPAIVLLSFNKIFSPMITDIYEKREMGRLDELFKISTKWGLYVSLPLLIVVIFCPSPVLRVVYGESYGTGTTVLLLITLAQIVNTATGSVASILSMTGYQKTFLFSTGIAFIACVGLNLGLTPLFGAIGAAVSLGCGIALLNILLLCNVRRILGLWPYDRRYYKLLIALLPTAVMVFLLKQIWVDPSSWELLFMTIASYGIFAVGLIVMKLEHYELLLIKATVQKFIGK